MSQPVLRLSQTLRGLSQAGYCLQGLSQTLVGLTQTQQGLNQTLLSLRFSDPAETPIHTSPTAIHMIHAPPSAVSFAVGDRVRCRDAAKKGWHLGTVTDVDGPKVCIDSGGTSRGFKYDEVEPARDFNWEEVGPARPESFPL
eukprot:gene15605-biopygen4559